MMTIFVWVDPTAAIMAGKTSTGYLAVEIDEEFLSYLSAEERQLLALHVGNTAKNERKTHIGFFIGFGVKKLTAATIDEVKSALKDECETKKKIEMEYERQIEYFIQKPPIRSEIDSSYNDGKIWINYKRVILSVDPSYGEIDITARADDRVQKRLKEIKQLEDEENEPTVAAVKAQAKKLRDQAEEAEKTIEKERMDAIDAFVATKEDLAGRFAQGLLPEHELMSALKSKIFAPLSKFPLYSAIEQIYCECGEGEIEHQRETADDLSLGEYNIMQKIKEAAPENAAFKLIAHSAYCSSCNEGKVYKKGLLITVDWYGWKLYREYAL